MVSDRAISFERIGVLDWNFIHRQHSLSHFDLGVHVPLVFSIFGGTDHILKVLIFWGNSMHCIVPGRLYKNNILWPTFSLCLLDWLSLPASCWTSSLEPKHFSDLVAEGPSVKSEDLHFCATFSAEFELKKLRMLACDIFVEAFQTDHVFWLGNEQSRYPFRK